MVKTTVYLPEDLEVRLDAEAAASGVRKAELIRQGIALLLDSSTRPKRAGSLPLFNSRRPLTADGMDQAVYEHIKERVARR